MKGIPIKRNRKTIIFILTQGVWSSPYMSLCILFTSRPLRPSTPYPLHSSLFCNMWLMWAFVLYALTALFGQWENSSRTSLFTVASVKDCVGLLFCFLFSFFTFFFCWVATCYSVQFQLNCVCAVIISSSPGTEQFTVNSTKGAVPGQFDVLLSLKKTTLNCFRHLVSAVTELHSVLL